jgi:hypothetical protein
MTPASQDVPLYRVAHGRMLLAEHGILCRRIADLDQCVSGGPRLHRLVSAALDELGTADGVPAK